MDCRFKSRHHLIGDEEQFSTFNRHVGKEFIVKMDKIIHRDEKEDIVLITSSGEKASLIVSIMFQVWIK